MKTSAAALLLALAACSSAAPADTTPAPATTTTAPASAGALNPVGRYEFATVVNGSPLNGTLSITGTAGAYGGTLESNMLPPIPVTSVTVAGQQMTVVLNAPQGPVTLVLNFNGDAYTGTWALGGDGGDVSGRRIS